MIFRWWRCGEALEVGQARHRAVVAFMISQTGRPPDTGRRASHRSTVASVWPARTRTPPSRARSGKRWPGIAKSRFVDSGSISTSTVLARSAAEMPVVTPVRASTETVNGVPNSEPLSCGFTIIGMPSSSMRSAGHRDADQAAAVLGHEVDAVGGDELGRDDEVAFVLAALVVDDDDKTAGAKLLDCFFDRRHHVVATFVLRSRCPLVARSCVLSAVSSLEAFPPGRGLPSPDIARPAAAPRSGR